MSELEQFCLLAKTQKSLACSALIQQVLSHKKIFSFGELLNIDSVQALRGTEFQKCWNSLELFAFGTYDEYMSNPSDYLVLTASQVTKLKMLTLLSLASTSKSLKYDVLLQRLHLSSVRELEDLIIEAIYAGLVSGKLDQAKQVFHIAHAQSRDVRPTDIDSLIEKLSQWKERCGKLQEMIKTSNSIIESSKLEANHEQEQAQFLVDQAKKRIKDSIEGGAEFSELGGWKSEPIRTGRPLKRSLLFKQ